MAGNVSIALTCETFSESLNDEARVVLISKSGVVICLPRAILSGKDICNG